MKKSILFVCMGNICRSPGAEAIFNKKLKENFLEDRFKCDSAGTIAYHVGEPADYRMQQHAKRRGINISSISRRFNPKYDFDNFDLIMAMDDQNLNDLKLLARNETDRQKINLITDFRINLKFTSVPDPYYGGEAGFEIVFDILDDACNGLISKLSKNEILIGGF